jgi:hypothetical protein
VRAREPSGDLVGILVHDGRKPQEPVTLIAERGRLAMTEDGRACAGRRQSPQLDAQTGRLQLLYFERYSVDLGRIAQRTSDRWRERASASCASCSAAAQRERRLYRSRSAVAEGHNGWPRRCGDDARAGRARLPAVGRLQPPRPGTAAAHRDRDRVALLAARSAAHNAISKWAKLAPLAYAIVVLPGVVSLWWLCASRGAAAPLRRRRARASRLIRPPCAARDARLLHRRLFVFWFATVFAGLSLSSTCSTPSSDPPHAARRRAGVALLHLSALKLPHLATRCAVRRAVRRDALLLALSRSHELTVIRAPACRCGSPWLAGDGGGDRYRRRCASRSSIPVAAAAQLRAYETARGRVAALRGRTSALPPYRRPGSVQRQ